MKKIILHMFFLLCTGAVFSHSVKDSLLNLLKTQMEDTSRATALLMLGEELYLSAPDSAEIYWLECMNFTRKLIPNTKDKNKYIALNKSLSSSMNNLAYLCQMRGQITKSFTLYRECLKIDESLNDKEGMAYSLNSMGALFQLQDDTTQALILFRKALKIREEIGDEKGIMFSLANLGHLYLEKNVNDKALKYFVKLRELSLKKNIVLGIANSYHNLGTVLFRLNQNDTALKLFRACAEIREKNGDKRGLAFTYANMAGVAYHTSLKEKGSKSQQLLKEALDRGLLALTMGKELGFPDIIRVATQSLKEIYLCKKDYKNALEMTELYVAMNDSLTNEETKKLNLRNQLKYEYEKKAAADSVKADHEKKVVQAQLKQEQVQRYSLFVGLLLVVVFALFMVNRFRITSKQKKLIEEQKKTVEMQKLLVEVKQREVLDSIHYAKRIQNALVTSEYYIYKKLRLLNRKK